MNCIIIDDSEVIIKQLENFINKTDELNWLGSYENPLKALKKLSDDAQIDLIFLDIELPDMSGLELLDNLKSNPIIIIISGNEKYAINAFDYNVTDYLLKPISYSRFYKAVDRAVNKLKESSPTNNAKEVPRYKTEFFIKGNNKFIKIQVSDLLFIKARGNYLELYTWNQRYITHATMKSINDKLDPDKLVRVHRSYFININKIKSMSGNYIYVEHDEGIQEIPIGKNYKSGLMSKINLMR